MQKDKGILLFLISFVLIILLAGCGNFQETVKIKPAYDSNSMEKRFQSAGPNTKSMIDTAMELAEKNSKLLDENSELKQKIQELTAENEQLKKTIGVLEPELKQTKKELAQANDLMVEMRIELNNWKNNILGFRDEIRDADKMQLETLRRILEVLGGEIESTTSQQQDKDTTKVSLNN